LAKRPFNKFARDTLRWFDAGMAPSKQDVAPERFNWFRCLPFIALHAMCFGVFWVGWSWFAISACLAIYLLRMFAITGFYHRYFSHKSFKTSRFMQFLFGVAGCAAVQRGPLWWAAHHRTHHQHSDGERDVHSPVRRGFWWSHVGWFTCDAHFATNKERVRDLSKFPELRFLDRFDILIPVALATALFAGGALLARHAPGLGTNGPQLLIWGFFISTALLFHATAAINSLAHVFGRRRFAVADNSRNNFWLALLTLGEGWHNNHHRWPTSVRQGFLWWEIDLTYYGLRLMKSLGLIWDLKSVPAKVKYEARFGQAGRKGVSKRMRRAA